MLNSYADFSFNIVSLRMTVVSVETLENSHWHCGSRDKMFLNAEKENSRCSLSLPLLFISKVYSLKAYNISYK